MQRNTMYLAASVLIVLALILLVVGLPDRPALWWAGLGALAVALALSFATRWAKEDEEEPELPSEAAPVADEEPPP